MVAASAWKVYNEAKKYLLDGTIDLDTNVLGIKIVKGGGATAVSDFTRSTFASCGTAVTFAGAKLFHTIDTVTLGSGASAKVTRFDCANEVFTASGAQTSLLYMVLGVATTGGKAIAWSKISAAQSLGAGSTLTVTINASGIFELSGGVT